MKDVIRVQVEKQGEYGNFKTDIDGDNADIIGALVCILNMLIEDDKYDLLTEALELSSQDIILRN